MQGNDLDNMSSPRVLVHISAVFTGELSLDKVLLVIPSLTTEYVPAMTAISQYRRDADKGLRFDLFAYENDGYPADAMYDALDGVNHPFNHLLIFRDIGNLSDYLLVNFDVKSVIDPQNPMAFGARSA